MWTINHAERTAAFTAPNQDVWHYKFHTYKISTYAVYGNTVGTVASQDSSTIVLNIDGKHVEVSRAECIGLTYHKIVRSCDAAAIVTVGDPQDSVVAYNTEPVPLQKSASVANAVSRQKKRQLKVSHRKPSIFKEI